MFAKIIKLLVVLILLSFTEAVDLKYTDITIVTDDTRFMTRNPEAILTAFQKTHHSKGNYIFTAGTRISGDRLILNFHDEKKFTKVEDVEVELTYPAKGQNGATLTAIQILVDLSSDAADAFFIDGGIDNTFAEILLVCNKTLNYTYQIYIYGY